MQDDFGDRMKAYERIETDRHFMPLLPVYARLDGRSFSKFTSTLDQPFDEEFSSAMIDTTRHLVEQTNACIGYTQSDEISLVWLQKDYGSELFFGGKVQKLVSVLAGMATASFSYESRGYPALDKRVLEMKPHFDCRVFQLPSKVEAANAILWRERDAIKNGISKIAQEHFSHQELMNKSSAEKENMLMDIGVFCNGYKTYHTRGCFIQKREKLETLTSSELEAIPERHRPLPESVFNRSFTGIVQMPSFNKVKNRVEVIFDGADPLA